MDEALAFFRRFSSDPPISFPAVQAKALQMRLDTLRRDSAQRALLAAVLVNDLLAAQPLLHRSISLEHVCLCAVGDSLFFIFDDALLRLILFFHPQNGNACYHLSVQHNDLPAGDCSFSIDAAALRAALKHHPIDIPTSTC